MLASESAVVISLSKSVVFIAAVWVPHASDKLFTILLFIKSTKLLHGHSKSHPNFYIV